MIYMYEAGQRNPSTLALKGLAALYGKSVEWFFGKEEEPKSRIVRLDAETRESSFRSGSDSSAISPTLEEVVTRLNRIESAVQSMAIEGPKPEDDVDDVVPAIRPVEVVELAAAAGGGTDVYDETVVGKLWFRRD